MNDPQTSSKFDYTRWQVICKHCEGIMYFMNIDCGKTKSYIPIDLWRLKINKY